MSKTLTILLALSGWLTTLHATAQTNFIKVGKYQAHPTRLLARYADHVVVQSVETTATLNKAGLSVRRRYSQVPGLVVLDVAEQNRIALQSVTPANQEALTQQLLARIVSLRDSGLFAYVEPDYVVTNLLVPNDKAFVDGTLWGLRNEGQNRGVKGADIGATNAWEITTGSTNVIVGVVDTGIRYTHQELRTQMWRNPGETAGNGLDDDRNGFIDDVYGINAFDGTADPFDDNDHGTHVSGTIGAAANDGNPHVGVTWNVQLMACKFLGAQGFGFTSDAITCIDYAVSKKARVLNNSWGGGPFDQALFDSITAARNQGVLFVAAAGNSASNHDTTPEYPASYKIDNIIAVAALDRSDKLAFFSSFGSTTVHLGAPGVEIYSSTAGSDSEYQVFQGTSMAAPHVTGVAALILSKYTNATLTELRERILQTTVPVAALQGKSITGGRVNAFNALNAAADGKLEISVTPPDGSALLAGSSTPMFVRVSDLFPITNATVTGTISGRTNVLTFNNAARPPDLVSNDNIYSTFFSVPTNTNSVTITLAITAPGKTNSTNSVTYTIVPRPANDDFENAAKIPSQGAFGDAIVLATNKFTTIQPGEPLHAKVASVAGSMWWNWSPAVNGPVVVDTTGSSFDTVLAVYTGTNLNSLTEVASVDDVGSKQQGFVNFGAKQGTTYRIVVAGYDTNAVGEIHLRVEPNGLADTNAPIATITSPASGLNVTTNRIVVSGTAQDPQPSASGVKEVLVQVNGGISSPATGTTNWSATVLLSDGVNTIRVVAGDFADNVSAPVSITVTYKPLDPPNDVFANATALSGVSGTVSNNTAKAGKEFDEPFHGGNEGGKSVWWSWQAPTDGVLFLSTEGSTFDTLMGLYTGTRVSSLTTVAQNDDAFAGVTYSQINQAVKANETYRIAVDGFGGSSGTAILQYAFLGTNVLNVTVSSTGGGSVSPSSGFYAFNSTVKFTATPDKNYEFVGWEGGVTSSQNPLTVVVTANLTITARFRAHQFADDFQSGGLTKLPWATSGNAPWSVPSGGAASASGPVSSKGTAVSQMPASYQPSSVFTVTTLVTPVSSVGAYYVQDQPPLGWQVSAISENGSFDATSKSVRWGPFFDNQTRTLTYQVTPSINAAGAANFTGTATFDGEAAAITGVRQTVLLAARSGAITDGQQSSLILVTNLSAGTGSFDLRVSSEEGWDVLEFYLNGVRQQRWSGEVGWLTYLFPVSAGTNRLEWRYVKDANNSVGLDAAFIDNVELSLGGQVVPPTAPTLSIARRLDGSLHILLQGQPNQQFNMQGSVNLIDWQSISTLTIPVGGVVDFVDPDTSRQYRFYRAVAR